MLTSEVVLVLEFYLSFCILFFDVQIMAFCGHFKRFQVDGRFVAQTFDINMLNVER